MLLLEPITVGRMELRNRVMITGHGTGLAEGEIPGSRYIAYLAERARGGVGLIETEAAAVHPTGKWPGLCYVGSDACIPGYRAAAEAVHAHGARLTAQIGHEGRQIRSTHTGLPLWSASAIPCPVNREMPKEMEPEDIREIVAAYAAAAVRIKRAGLDAVTIHGLHNTYFLGQFASPWVNRRTDAYGGSFDHRLRIVEEVVHAVRDAVGRDFTVGLQMSGDDFDARGLSADDYAEIARRLDAGGTLDWIMVKAGRFGLSFEVPDMQHASATWLHLAARIKGIVRHVKVGVVGRIDPWQAESVVRDGQADLVAMTRQHIADPETVTKLREGRAQDIRPCIGCNQGCVDTLDKHSAITCTVNPAVGREGVLGAGTLARASTPGRVVVIGGGPAGLKAAEIAARRGHRVILLEATDRLGGQILVAARAPHRRDLVAAVDWLAQQVEVLGVDVRLKTPVTAEEVLGLEPDVAVVATGARPTTRPIGLIGHGLTDLPETGRVTTAYDVLAGWSRPSGRVLVVDDGEGTFKGVGVAEALADAGCRVTLVAPTGDVGTSIGRLSKAALMPRLFDKGIRVSPYTLYRGMEGGTAHLTVQGRDVDEAADWVVVAGWHEPDAELYFSLKGRARRLVRIGDCLAARTMLEAIREGEAAGRAA